MPDCDAVVIGGGFFGAEIALELRRLGFGRIVLAERAPALLRRASYVNQARVHHGYHYPRALVTASRSQANFATFLAEYDFAVLPGTTSTYAIARTSRVSTAQFETFCRMVGLPCTPAPRAIAELFDDALIAAVFLVDEPAFDATKLAAHLRTSLEAAAIELRLGTEARIAAYDTTGVDVALGGDRLRAAYVFNCTYAALDGIGIPLQARLKRELAEMLLIVPPPPLRSLAVTVMDGPFFSTMPFPAAGLHSLSHVRYTPHESRTDAAGASLLPHRTNRVAMLRDSQRYLPCLAQADIVRSIFDIKTVLAGNEADDGRPILAERSPDCPRILSILGAKIDNIYDVRAYLRAQDWSIAA